MAQEITQLLSHAAGADPGARAAAETQLHQMQETNFAAFVISLAAEMVTDSKPAVTRQLAGLVLKNAVDAKEETRRRELQARWTATDANAKSNVRQTLLQCLKSTDQAVCHTAALVIPKIAVVDLPANQWPNLIQELLSNMNAPADSVAPGTRQGTLEALGYVCEEMDTLDQEVLQPEQVNLILTAVVAGMRPEEPEQGVRLAATTALTNAIAFAQHNFNNDQERNYIMQMVCQATTAGEERIRVAAFTCLHEIAAHYYEKLPPYMQEVYNITVRAIKSDTEEVGMQAIEFWCTLDELEADMIEEGEDSENHHFIKAVAPHLVPVLLEELTKQEDQFEDENAWSKAMAAGVCLQLTARVVGDDIVPLVMPFVTSNISKNTGPEDWHFREAATFTFGSILEGPSSRQLLEIAKQALPFLLQALKDPKPYVRDTTAWTVGRIFEFVHDDSGGLITQDNLPGVVAVLMESLKDEPSIAVHVAAAIGYLAGGFSGTPGGTSPLSPYFKDMLAALLQCGQRQGSVHNQKIQFAAFEAVGDLVRTASQDTLDTVAQLIPVFLQELANTFNMAPGSMEALEKQADTQGQLAGVLQVISQKLGEHDSTKPMILQYGDQLMQGLLRVMGARGDTVHEDALLAVGSFTYACGRQFQKYMQAFHPFLMKALSNHKEWQVCMSAVGVVGDVCRNLEEDFLPWCDETMSVMVANLGSNDVHRSIKPAILGAFGDIALALGGHFEKYLDTVRRMLQQAMHLSIVQAQQSLEGDDFWEYNMELRNGILEAYSGIFQGLGEGKAQQHCTQDIGPILAFLSSVGREGLSADEAVIKHAVCLLGDILVVLPGPTAQALQASRGQEWQKLVQTCQENSDLLEDTEWAITRIQGAVMSATSS